MFKDKNLANAANADGDFIHAIINLDTECLLTIKMDESAFIVWVTSAPLVHNRNDLLAVLFFGNHVFHLL